MIAGGDPGRGGGTLGLASRTSGLEVEPRREAVVASTCVESGGETLVLDPLAPPAGATEVWERLDAHPPTAVVVLKPDHVRDVDLFVRRYGARAFGPDRFDRHDIPETELEPIYPGKPATGGLIALHDGRGRNETPLWMLEQRALVFADALTAPKGELRVWSTPWHQERVLCSPGCLCGIAHGLTRMRLGARLPLSCVKNMIES
jgi:hypothetical protein